MNEWIPAQLAASVPIDSVANHPSHQISLVVRICLLYASRWQVHLSWPESRSHVRRVRQLSLHSLEVRQRPAAEYDNS